MLTRLRRGIEAIDFGAVLRSLGLEYINTLLRGWQSQWTASERPEKGLSGSIWHAMGRNIVHILPMAVLIVLIVINWGGNYYIGPTFIENAEKNGWFLSGIQMCAKLEELLCIASLTTIMLHSLRHELLGDGIPIGLLGSGIWFSSLSAFWSAEFLGSLSWSLPSWRKARFYLLLIGCGCIAATIGPASAILMLPREQNVPAGGASFYLHGSPEEYFPDTVTSLSEPKFCTMGNATQYSICPSGGYDSLKNTITRFNYGNWCPEFGESAKYSPVCQARGAEGNRQWSNFLVQSTDDIIPPILNSFRSTRYWFSAGSAVAQPHAATMIVSQYLRNTWPAATGRMQLARNRQFQWTYELETRGSATSPWVRAQCGIAQNLSADATSARFPHLIRDKRENFTRWTYDPAEEWKQSSILSLDRNESSHMRVQWVPLPIAEFGDDVTGRNVTGVLIELPWVFGSRVALGCSVAAAWHNSTIRSLRSSSYSAWGVVVSGDDYLAHDDSPDADLSNKPVTLDSSWLQLLTPAVTTRYSASGNSTLNTIESFLEAAYFPQIPNEIRTLDGICSSTKVTTDQSMSDTDLWNRSDCKWLGKDYLTHTIAMMVADGLSRYHSHSIQIMHHELRDWTHKRLRLFNQTGMMVPTEVEETAELSTDHSAWLQFYVYGYAYYPCRTSDGVALFGVCVYLALATAYILYTLFRRGEGTSSAWDSITELLVLCQNSPPPATSHKLDNTSAGIEQLKTYQAVVKVRAFPPEDGQGNAKLRLVLDGDLPAFESVIVSAVDTHCSSSSLSDKSGQSSGSKPISDGQMVSFGSSLARSLRSPRQKDGDQVELDYKYS